MAKKKGDKLPRWQVVALVLTFVSFFVLVAYAAYMGSRGGGIQTADKTLFAKSGTMRQNAMMLTTDKKTAPEKKTPDLRKMDATDDTITAVHSLSQDPAEREAAQARQASEEAAREALNAITPEEGIKRLEQQLAGGKQVAEAAMLYATLGTLLAQTDPPQIDAAKAAFDQAAKQAQTPEEAYDVAYARARVQTRTGLTHEALRDLVTVLANQNKRTDTRLQLRVLQGILHAQGGDLDDAEEALREVVLLSAEQLKEAGPKAADVYRKACLELARVYRKAGRNADADNLVRLMQRRLKLLETP